MQVLPTQMSCTATMPCTNWLREQDDSPYILSGMLRPKRNKNGFRKRCKRKRLPPLSLACSSLVESLPSIPEALGSILSVSIITMMIIMNQQRGIKSEKGSQ